MPAQSLEREHMERVLQEVLRDEGIGLAPRKNWLRAFFENSDLPGGLEAASSYEGWGLLILCGGISLYWMARWLQFSNSPSSQSLHTASAAHQSLDARIAELSEQAQRAEAAANWRAALQSELDALILQYAQKEALEVRDAWTQRECMQRISDGSALRAKLEHELNRDEPIVWGRHAAVAADLQRVRELRILLAAGGKP